MSSQLPPASVLAAAGTVAPVAGDAAAAKASSAIAAPAGRAGEEKEVPGIPPSPVKASAPPVPLAAVAAAATNPSAAVAGANPTTSPDSSQGSAGSSTQPSEAGRSDAATAAASAASNTAPPTTNGSVGQGSSLGVPSGEGLLASSAATKGPQPQPQTTNQTTVVSGGSAATSAAVDNKADRETAPVDKRPTSAEATAAVNAAGSGPKPKAAEGPGQDDQKVGGPDSGKNVEQINKPRSKEDEDAMRKPANPPPSSSSKDVKVHAKPESKEAPNSSDKALKNSEEPKPKASERLQKNFEEPEPKSSDKPFKNSEEPKPKSSDKPQKNSEEAKPTSSEKHQKNLEEARPKSSDKAQKNSEEAKLKASKRLQKFSEEAKPKSSDKPQKNLEEPKPKSSDRLQKNSEESKPKSPEKPQKYSEEAKPKTSEKPQKNSEEAKPKASERLQIDSEEPKPKTSDKPKKNSEEAKPKSSDKPQKNSGEPKPNKARGGLSLGEDISASNVATSGKSNNTIATSSKDLAGDEGVMKGPKVDAPLKSSRRTKVPSLSPSDEQQAKIKPMTVSGEDAGKPDKRAAGRRATSSKNATLLSQPSASSLQVAAKPASKSSPVSSPSKLAATASATDSTTSGGQALSEAGKDGRGAASKQQPSKAKVESLSKPDAERSNVEDRASPRKRKQPTTEAPEKSALPVRESKRARTQTTQLYNPEIQQIMKTIKEREVKHKGDKSTAVFFKGEHLAVRNADGGFFICQTLQNIFKTSKKIKIQWLSESSDDKEVYTPEYYDRTEFETILTSVEMEKHGKKKFRLPKVESERIGKILLKAQQKEQGKLKDIAMTEDNPDGLDVSIYKDEDQLKELERKKRLEERKLAKALATEEPVPPVKEKSAKASSSKSPQKGRKKAAKKSKKAGARASKAGKKTTPKAAAKPGRGLTAKADDAAEGVVVADEATTKPDAASSKTLKSAAPVLPPPKRVGRPSSKKDGDTGQEASAAAQATVPTVSAKKSSAEKPKELSEPTTVAPSGRASRKLPKGVVGAASSLDVVEAKPSKASEDGSSSSLKAASTDKTSPAAEQKLATAVVGQKRKAASSESPGASEAPAASAAAPPMKKRVALAAEKDLVVPHAPEASAVAMGPVKRVGRPRK